MSWREVPIVGAVGVVSMDLLLWGGDLVGAVVLSLGDIIPILSMLGAYVAPHVDWLSESVVSTLLLVAALVYIGVSIGRLVSDR